MTKSKYLEVIQIVFNEFGYIDYSEPDNWPNAKDRLVALIKEIDQAHQVYQMENTVKVGK